MPTYEYKCPNGHVFEKFFSTMNDKRYAVCPTCKKRAVRQISGGTGLVFKGSGFYETDYKRAGEKKPAGDAKQTEIAGPGFINFFLAEQQLWAALSAVVAAGPAYGRTDAGKGAPVNVEFVSANPTGPLHVGHGRQAALGDAIASLLEWTGWKVSREFYYNDAGAQIENLAVSVQARVRQFAGERVEIPEGGYHGEYIREIAE